MTRGARPAHYAQDWLGNDPSHPESALAGARRLLGVGGLVDGRFVDGGGVDLRGLGRRGSHDR
jgi:hypothetical protein